MTKITWYEVFADDDDIPALLLLRPTDGGFEVLDPCRPEPRLFSCAQYTEARNWLNEDEFYFLARKEVED
jgi:hypothetical protein